MIKVYEKNGKESNMKWWDQDYNVDNDPAYDFIGYIPNDTEMGAFEYQGQLYTAHSASCHSANHQKDHPNEKYIDFKVSKINIEAKEDVDDVYGADEITCPVCGAEESDSWEASEYDDNRECESCGAIFAYERHIEVSYQSKLVEYPNIKKV